MTVNGHRIDFTNRYNEIRLNRSRSPAIKKKKNGLFVFPYDELKQFYDWNETDQRRVTTTCGLPNKRIQVIQFGL